MMEQKQLRRADLVTGIILFLGGVWICLEAFKMPMKDSFGGVQNVWYVSPALFPLITGVAILILSAMLLVNAVRSIGREGFAEWKTQLAARFESKQGLSEPSVRFLGIILLFITFVFLFIPRIDFFLGSVLFLLTFITMFHYDDDAIFHRLLIFYLAGCAIFVLYFWFGISALLEGAFKYSSDVLFLIFLIVYGVYARLQAADEGLRKKFRISLLLSIVIPLLLVPIFRYFLLVPLPKEGGIIKLMNLIYYTIT